MLSTWLHLQRLLSAELFASMTHSERLKPYGCSKTVHDDWELRVYVFYGENALIFR